MNYEALAQNALRGVVRMALERVVAQGLPGDHHFYITFESQHPGVKMSDWLKERYPEEMTIVVQHQFWGLEVRPDSFDITLSFQKIGEPLTVPYEAVKAFFDPSVQFMLQFKPATGQPGAVKKPNPALQPAPQPAKLEVKQEPAAAEDKPKDAAPTTGEVVSLDKFRKK
ncbi:hypothetical protein sos41_19270 [Alphaproteobacteria bacterium SO-S41]|nr:hypothetical protein sos41_19270 [Alphaproteobacteria bacterium SO-S41]